MISYKTVKFYDENAKSFVARTENADVSKLRMKFLELIPAGGSILDWGCGSGRDTLAFLHSGYEVDATDGSEELATIASQKSGIKVQRERFEDLDVLEKYNGIWACASLLHVEKEYLPEIFELAQKALKLNGIMYASFKYGNYEGERCGRFFTDMTEKRICEVIKEIKNLHIEDQWITTDVRIGRGDEKWLNLILRKLDIN